MMQMYINKNTVINSCNLAICVFYTMKAGVQSFMATKCVKLTH